MEQERKRFKVSTGEVVALPFLGYRPKPQYVVRTSAGRVAVRGIDLAPFLKGRG